jgi:hypothetical protein
MATATKPPTTPDLTTVQEQVVDAIKLVNELTIDAVRTVADVTVPFVSALPKLPFSDLYPSPQETIESGFVFAEKVLATQHDFAKQLVDALRPAAENGKS